MDNNDWQKTRQSGPQQTVGEAVSAALNKQSSRPAAHGFANEKKAVGLEQIHKAVKTLNEYKAGKANLEQRVIENEQWYKLRHWECMRRNAKGEKKSGQVEPTSAWLFNSIQNKHADAMDNFPAANVQPREEGDKAEAQKLSSIIPVVLDQCEFEDVYCNEQDAKLRGGTGVYGIFWDASLLNGLGDISIRNVDILNLFWEPGITDIQQSRNLFHVEMMDNEVLEEMYPQLKGKIGGNNTMVAQYIYDDSVNTVDKSAVISWYYKRYNGSRAILHFCKFVGDQILFATENEPEYAERGWYDHGMYPYVFDPLFRTAGTPCGFGYIDVAKSVQEYIDRGNQAIMENLLVNARPRHFIRTDGGVNEKEYADLSNDFIHVEGSLGEDSIRPVYQSRAIAGTYVSILNNKVDELKEVTGNRDISTGGTASGVTAASAIAALQEAGSKLSRDSNKSSHRAFRKVVLMVIELIRQFYDMPRQFRIVGEMGAQAFTDYDNSGIAPQDQGMEMGVDMGIRVPLFDVSISTEKNSPYSRLSANELALQFYQAGFFNPQLADQALCCMEMMDFNRRDEIMQMIRANGQAYRMAQMQMQQMQMQGQQPVQEEPAEPVPNAKRKEDGKASGAERSDIRRQRERVANAADPG